MEKENKEDLLKKYRKVTRIMLIIIAVLVIDRVYECRTKAIVAEANGEIIPIYCSDNEVVYGAEFTEPDELSDFEYEKTVEEFVPVDCILTEELQKYTWLLCKANNIDFTLVMSLMKQESQYNESMISSTNDYGLMQINKINHDYLSEVLGISDYLDARQNIRAGIYILRVLFTRYDDTYKVLMAYNMGESNAKECWSNGIYETDYCEKIMLYQAEYKRQLGW